MDGLFQGKSQSKMDDLNRGYPHLWKPQSCVKIIAHIVVKTMPYINYPPGKSP